MKISWKEGFMTGLGWRRIEDPFSLPEGLPVVIEPVEAIVPCQEG